MPNISDILTDRARRSPETTALRERGRSISFPELDAQVWRASNWLVRAGVTRGEVVALSCRSDLASLVTTFALARIGASALSLPLADPRALRIATASRCAARRLVTDTRAVDDAGIDPLLIEPGAFGTAAGEPDRSVRDDDPVAPWLVIIGSGSTGTPKRIDLSHRVSFERANKYIAALRLTAADRGMCAAVFDFAATKQRFIEVLAAGGSMVFWDGEKRDPLRLCREEKVTVLNANVVHLERLLARLEPGASDALPGLRVLRIGASTVSPKLRERVVRQLTPNIHVVYGLNEFGIVSLADSHEAIACPEGVGKAVEGVSMEVVDASGRELPAGTVGLVRVRGLGLIDGYVGDETASARAFRDGWFYPGDLASKTASGSVLLRGRADHMMILDGINVYPTEIEQAMLSHESVADAAAVPMSSPVHQDIPVCAVALVAGAHATEEELMAFARERLGARRPRRIAILTAIPRNTGQGKLERAALLQLLGEALDVPVRTDASG